MDHELLKTLGIAFHDTEVLTEAYEKLAAVPMLPLASTLSVLILDLNNLPLKPLPFKEVFIRWMLQANEPRLREGLEPILTYELAKRCPIWKIIRMPVRSMSLKHAPKAPTLMTNSKQPKPGSINKR